MNMKIVYLISAYLLLLSIVLLPSSHVYAQEQEVKPIMLSTKSLDIEVLLDSIPEPEKEVKMQITFLTKTGGIQQHVDYVITINDGSGNIIERIPPNPQPLLHTDPGRITVPYIFRSEGNYTVNIDIVGILFQPIPTESAEFNITVVPEFPAMVLAILASTIAIYIMLVRVKGYGIFTKN